MLESSEYPKAKIIGLGEMGKSIIDKVLEDISYLNYLIIDDNLNEIDKDKEYEINDFLSNTDVIFVVGLINDNTNYILNLIADIVYIDIFPIVMLTTNSKNNDIEELKNIIPNTFVVENYASIEIYKAVSHILYSADCFPSYASRYGAIIDSNINDIKSILSDGNNHNIGFGSGIGFNRSRNSVLMAINNLGKYINIPQTKSILFLFKLPTHTGIFEVEDAIEIFKEKFNYNNDILLLCVADEQMPKDESEVIIITSD